MPEYVSGLFHLCIYTYKLTPMHIYEQPSGLVISGGLSCQIGRKGFVKIQLVARGLKRC